MFKNFCILWYNEAVALCESACSEKLASHKFLPLLLLNHNHINASIADILKKLLNCRVIIKVILWLLDAQRYTGWLEM